MKLDKLEEKYEVQKVLGTGAHGVVLLVRERRLHILRAAKVVLDTRGPLQSQARKDALAEVNFLKAFSHPYIPRIIEVFDSEDSFCIVMDYVEGRSLRELLLRDGKIPKAQTVDILLQLCQVLSYLHGQSQPVIYGDLKPENIMRRKDGMITLVDFGTAEQIRQFGYRRSMQGTEGYAAPELYVADGKADIRSDIYSLGVLAVELLTGSGPKTGAGHHRRKLFDRVGFRFFRILRKCMRKNPKRRYQSMAELCKKLYKITR